MYASLLLIELSELGVFMKVANALEAVTFCFYKCREWRLAGDV